MSDDQNEQQDTTFPVPTSTALEAGGLLKILSIPHLLSLDAPVVAVVWARLFADTLGLARLLPGVYAILFCSVWCIYLGDRLLDTAPWQKRISQTERHLFVRKHWWQMLVLMLLPAGGIVWLGIGDQIGGSYAVPSGIVGSGILLLALVALYFVLRLANHRYVNALVVACLGLLVGLVVYQYLRLPLFLVAVYLVLVLGCSVTCVFLRASAMHAFPRELLCGIVFALGTVMPVYWHVSKSATFSIPVEMLYDAKSLINFDTFLFAALCVVNCIGISIWEKVADSEGNDPQAVAQYAPGIEDRFPLIAFSVILVAVGLMWDVSFALTDSWEIKLSVALSTVSLLVIHRLRSRLHPLVSRVLADSVLLWPLLLLGLT